jgi:hypothetical protein
MTFHLSVPQKFGVIALIFAFNYTLSSWVGYQYHWRSIKGEAREVVWYLTKETMWEAVGVQKLAIFGEPAWYTTLKNKRAMMPQTTLVLDHGIRKIFIFPWPILGLLMSIGCIGLFVRTLIFLEKKIG